MSLDLDHLEAVAKAATPGPWKYQDVGVTIGHSNSAVVKPETGIDWIGHFYLQTSSCPNYKNNGVFIATFDPPMALSMIERIRELESR